MRSGPGESAWVLRYNNIYVYKSPCNLLNQATEIVPGVLVNYRTSQIKFCGFVNYKDLGPGTDMSVVLCNYVYCNI